MAVNLDKAYELREQLVLIRTAQPADIGKLRAFFATRNGGEQTLDWHLRRARYRPDFTRIARVGDALVGVMLIDHGRLQLGSATLDVGVIDWQLVPTGAQHEQLFTPLLGDLLGVLAENSLPIALISGDATAFAPFGFAPYQQRSVATGWQQTDSDAVLRPLVTDDLEDCAALYDATYRDLPLSETRTPADWSGWLAAQAQTHTLCDTHGRLIGYATAVHATITELAAADAGAARVLLARLPHQQLALPAAHRAMQAALWMGGQIRTQVFTEAAAGALPPLAGIVDPSLALTQLAPMLEQRLAHSRYAGWHGTVQIETFGEPVTLVCGEHVRVGNQAGPPDVRLRRVALSALAQLCLGARAIADMRFTGELGCDDTALGLLDSLFPEG